MAKKKKAASKASKPSSGKRVAKMKGGFGVFQIIPKDGATFKDPVDDLWPNGPVLIQIAGGESEDLPDTAAAEKWIKEHAGDYNGKELVIAQVKKTVKVSVETVKKVTLS